MIKTISFMLLVVLLTGCTSAGPYVTNIASDGADGLNIEKCMVQLNAFLGVVSTKNCTTQNIKVAPRY